MIKSEPDAYGWDHLLAEKQGRWDGVRNYAARNHLRSMKLGDWAFFYHSGKKREVVGICEVVVEHYPDPTASSGDFSAVDFSPVQAFNVPVSLKTIKADEALSEMVLVRSPRLSVQPVQPAEFRRVLSLGKTKAP